LPSGLGAPSDDPGARLTPAFDIPWLQPFPDARFDIGVRADMRLALVAAMQVLPPLQRAVLVLREVLEFSAAEAGDQRGPGQISRPPSPARAGPPPGRDPSRAGDR
jgi:RNA polymerase sigma-70 factor (ECF subfamily)